MNVFLDAAIFSLAQYQYAHRKDLWFLGYELSHVYTSKDLLVGLERPRGSQMFLSLLLFTAIVSCHRRLKEPLSQRFHFLIQVRRNMNNFNPERRVSMSTEYNK